MKHPERMGEVRRRKSDSRIQRKNAEQWKEGQISRRPRPSWVLLYWQAARIGAAPTRIVASPRAKFSCGHGIVVEFWANGVLIRPTRSVPSTRHCRLWPCHAREGGPILFHSAEACQAELLGFDVSTLPAWFDIPSRSSTRCTGRKSPRYLRWYHCGAGTVTLPNA